MQQMGTSVITSYIMKTYSNTTETTDPATWSSTVQTDENRQSNEKRQPPPSDSYNSGAQAKRRKAARLINLQPALIFNDRLREAMKAANVTPKQNDAQVSIDSVCSNASKVGLSKQYQEEVVKEVKLRIESDSDFKELPERFPTIRSL